MVAYLTACLCSDEAHSACFIVLCVAVLNCLTQSSLGTVENRGKNGKKNTANFCENRAKDTASDHGPENHYTVYKTEHLALTTIITCSARFSSVQFCRHGHIFSQ